MVIKDIVIDKAKMIDTVVMSQVQTLKSLHDEIEALEKSLAVDVSDTDTVNLPALLQLGNLKNHLYRLSYFMENTKSTIYWD